ncbi:uncharacterized protein LOC131629901 [Vicia villosa]|uniref:uncharacterized protein LOC131612591 n=1 Tax=Vicia villosa TaxID=3911 RepID=UPI00273C63B5|nr:uncharacterized protein LOC131612591 [Vicia villosa]XP_058756686.1 uncharacterized protein LOC131629901 [Vicia villosa]
MNIHTHISIPSFTSHHFTSRNYKFVCSKRDESPRNGDNKGDKSSTDWDKAWSKFKKQGKKTLFSNFSADKYVSWNPRRSDFPLSEEVDPIKKTERSNLKFWNSPTFSLGGALIILIFLLLYTLQAPINK